ncbi:uncharacterized protein LOC143249985 [Tachypleus tridentatus]|uniref:uncharacterized protein LOC143249985 n=1 Tax=Tachypleus tridentatus TaxID=6853 RepID=UPI003FD5E970
MFIVAFLPASSRLLVAGVSQIHLHKRTKGKYLSNIGTDLPRSRKYTQPQGQTGEHDPTQFLKDLSGNEKCAPRRLKLHQGSERKTNKYSSTKENYNSSTMFNTRELTDDRTNQILDREQH